MSAALAGHLPVVDRLLERGVDPSAATKDGWTALMPAAHTAGRPPAGSRSAAGAGARRRSE
jgi:ankyrin repeat protein